MNINVIIGIIMILSFLGMVWSVSYTHLDVYKRQAICTV